jgi:hypothetical protein
VLTGRVCELVYCLTNAVHVTAARLRFGMTLKGHGVGDGP